MLVPATFVQLPSLTFETCQEYRAPVRLKVVSTSCQELMSGLWVSTVRRLTMVWSSVRKSISWSAPNELIRCSLAEPAPMSIPVRVYGRSHQSRSMTAVIGSTISGAARVVTLTGPIGHSELSMSMIWRARTPCGVLVSIRRPALAVGAGGGAQLLASPTTVDTAVTSASALRRLRIRVGPGNVQHNLELE